jgi:hypothetical protein
MISSWSSGHGIIDEKFRSLDHPLYPNKTGRSFDPAVSDSKILSGLAWPRQIG